VRWAQPIRVERPLTAAGEESSPPPALRLRRLCDAATSAVLVYALNSGPHARAGRRHLVLPASPLLRIEVEPPLGAAAVEVGHHLLRASFNPWAAARGRLPLQAAAGAVLPMAKLDLCMLPLYLETVLQKLVSMDGGRCLVYHAVMSRESAVLGARDSATPMHLCSCAGYTST
jgi:hypothetical protein